MDTDKLLSVLNGAPPIEWTINSIRTLKAKLPDGTVLVLEKINNKGSTWELYIAEAEDAEDNITPAPTQFYSTSVNSQFQISDISTTEYFGFGEGGSSSS